MSKRLILMLCAALLCGVVVAACGDDEWWRRRRRWRRRRGDRRDRGRQGHRPNSVERRQGRGHLLPGQGHRGQRPLHDRRVQQEVSGHDLTAKLVEFPASADEQRNQFIQRQQAKSGDCDVFSSDVIWTAEFASQKWLYDMTPYIEESKGDFIEAPVETVTYDGKIWGVARVQRRRPPLLPHGQGRRGARDVAGGLQAGREQGRDRLPGRGLRGPDLRLPRAVLRRGRQVLSEDGSKADDRRGRERQGHPSMADGLKDGAAPKAVTTYMEPESLTAFQTGKYAYMRNWPYAYALNQKAPKVKGKFDVAPLPTFEGGEKAGILGGHNSVISVYSKNPGGALKLVDLIGSQRDPEDVRGAVLAVARITPRSTTTRRSRRRSRSRRAPRGHRAGRVPGRSRRSTRRSRRRSTRTSTRR